MEPEWGLYGVAFGGAAVLSWGLTPAALRLALRHGVLDRPGGHKRHDAAVPYLGGLAIIVAFSATVLAAALIHDPSSLRVGELAAILGLAVGLALFGLADDLRGLGATVRLAAQAAAGVALWLLGSGVASIGPDPVDLLVTVVWVVGVTNAFNLLDNMDGLSAGVAAIGAGWFFIIAAANGQFLVGALAAALAGCAVGFLRHNFHPASIYMGDAGSLYLGFLLAVIGIQLRFAAPVEVTFFVPILVLGVAIFDTALVVATRLLHRRHPFRGGRDHTSHRLVFLGVPVPAAVSLIYAGAVAVGWLGLIMSRLEVHTALLLMGFVLAGGVFLGVLLGRVPVYETSSRRALSLQPRDDPGTEGARQPPPGPGAGHRGAPAPEEVGEVS